MALATLKPRLSVPSLARTKVLEIKAGTVERQRGRAWMATRDRIALRDGYRCAKCGATWVPNRDHVDHIVELADGGTNDDANLQLLCDEPCHKEKTAQEAARRTRG